MSTADKNGEYRKNIEGWTSSLHVSGLDSLADRLNEENGYKGDIMARIVQTGLPVLATHVIRMPKFLEDPVGNIKNFPFPRYWISLLPLSPAFPKTTKLNLTPKEALYFIGRYREQQDGYSVLLGEYEKNVFGGNIVSNEKIVCVELVNGDHINIAQGSTKDGEPYVAKREDFETSFTYSIGDESIRKVIWMALSYIRRRDYEPERETDMRFLQGYFEFAVTSSPDRAGLRTVFLDYKTGPTFMNLRLTSSNLEREDKSGD